MSRRPPIALLTLVSALVAASCGTGEVTTEATPPPTIPNVGNLPGPLAVYATTTTLDDDAGVDERDERDEPDETSEPSETTVDDDDTEITIPDDSPGESLSTVGEVAGGPRVLVIGDSITEATGARYSGDLCAQLVPEGWQVAMDAENGRYIAAGEEVLDDRLDVADWDTAIINLGSNYDGDPETYGEVLRQMLNRLRPRPVVLVTVSEAEEDRAEVNYVLREASRRYENVRLVEWAEETKDDPALTGNDDLHLSPDGQVLLSSMIAEALGTAPDGPDGGACLDIDDDTSATTTFATNEDDDASSS